MITIIKIMIKKFFSFFSFSIKKDIDYIELIKKLIYKIDPTIFDVGANKGQSIIKFKKLFPKSTIHSFEPNKNETELLKKYNSQSVIINNVAVADKNYNTTLNVTKGHSGWSSIKKINMSSRWVKSRLKSLKIKKNFLSRQNIKCVSLDYYCKINNIKNIDILKIDTQGFEKEVIKGAKQLLKKQRIKIIIIELIFSKIYGKSINVLDIEKFLIPNSYKLVSVSEGGNIINNMLFQQDLIYITKTIYKKLLP